jgi:tetratricopeptide (TPR) repeat protein
MESTYLLKNLKTVLCFYFLTTTIVICQEKEDLNQLNLIIESSSKYDQEKEIHIDSLRNILKNTEINDLKSQYELNQQLFNEFKVFKRDSAFHYGLIAKQISLKLKDTLYIIDANIRLADICVSVGMYKEALDFLETIEHGKIPEDSRSLYYGLLGRCYSDMAEYSNIPYFYSSYNELARTYREKALSLTAEGTFFNSFLKIFNKSKNNQLQDALTEYKALLKEELDMRERALVNYMLGDLYLQLEENDKAIPYYIEAVIADIKTSTKESLAIIRLSELLFKKGDIKNASILIHKANEDALFYGAQQRKIQVGAILPLIEQEIVQIVEREKERLYWQYILVSIFLIIVICFTIIIYMQFRKLTKAKKIIAEAHKNLKKTNKQLINVNEQIKAHNIEIERVNIQLFEANKIKEEYLGFFFTQYDDIFEKFNLFKSTIEKNIDEGKNEKVKYHCSNYNLKREKEKLLQNFDSAFIKLFPNFIKEFNSLMKDEHKIELENDQLLTKELRIYALIRLGIKHSEIIAQILGYSVNSIYAYKTKIRNKSLISKDDFDQKLLEITTIKL